MKAVAAVVLLVGTVLAGSSPAPAEDAAQILFALQDASGEVRQRARRDDALSARAKRLQQQINELQDLIGTDKPLAPEYVRSLEHNSQLIRTAARPTVPTSEAAAILDDVIADKAIKIAHARSAAGLIAAGPPLVQVMVKTMRNANEVHGYFIYANPYRHRDAEPMNPFPNPTSPTVRALAPGLYLLMAVKNNTVASSKDYEVGSRGERRMELVLPVP